MPSAPVPPSGRHSRIDPDDTPPLVLALSSGALPAATLMQWINEDESAIDFATVWTCVVVPVATVVDWRLLPIALAPVAIRLVQRRIALRKLTHQGVSFRAIQQALLWVDEHEEAARGLALRTRVRRWWRAGIRARCATPSTAPDAAELLAEREVDRLAHHNNHRSAA